MNPGDILAWLTGLGGLGVGIWTLFGKTKDSQWSRVESERKWLTDEVTRLRQDVDKAKTRMDSLESELEDLKRHFNVLLDFLKDIISGQYNFDWVVARAKTLLERMEDDR